MTTPRVLQSLVLAGLVAALCAARTARAQDSTVTVATITRTTAATPATARQSVLLPTRRVPVALHTIARGAVLTADDFEYRDTTTHLAPDTNQITAGWVTRRTITAGEILHTPAVEPPVLVSANSPVLVEWVDGNVRLTIRGVAARNASLGERVPVRLELGKRVDGTVVAAGRVRID